MDMHTLHYLQWVTDKALQLSGVRRPGWEGSLGENGYTRTAESLPCSPETITCCWSISNTPIQN